MATPATIALTKELEAAVAVIEPQLVGMRSLANDSEDLSPETIAALEKEIADHRHRLRLCKTVLVDLAALNADGYPEMPKAEVSAAVIEDLQEQLAAITAAIAEFQALPQASNIDVSLGAPADKP